MPISLRGRRNKPEGWATDIAAEVGSVSRRQRLANNTPLWILSLLAIVGITVALIAASSGNSTKDEALLKPTIPGDTAKGNYLDAQHTKFVREFREMAHKRNVQVEARFLSDDKFKIVVPSDVGYDEIAYLSRFAALGIKRLFGNGAIINAFTRDSKNPNGARLTATTQWSERELNFITRPQRAMEAE